MTRLAAFLTLGLAATLTGALPAAAHTGLETGFSLVDGALHPLSGLDHIAAMVTVGLWAAVAGGHCRWAWPLAFVAAMVGGGIAARYGMALPAVEPAIAASVIVLGLAVASGLRVPLAAGALLIAAFAAFHGAAHGIEAPRTDFAGYAAGFAASTALLHAVGLGFALAVERLANLLTVRALGAAAAVVGIALAIK